MPAGRASRHQLGESLWELVETVGAPLAAATPVSRLASPGGQRASFRLRFADGRIYKGHRAESVDVAERIATLWSALAHPWFPGLLARHGRALLIEWVEGTAPAPADLTIDLVRRGGAAHAEIHAARPVPELIARYGPRGDGSMVALERSLAELVERGALPSREVKAMLGLARGHVPRDPAVGYYHGDFCAENLVVSPGGSRISIVDNETLSVKPLDEDLARTWYRWPMAEPQWREYLHAYAGHRSPAGFEAHLPFWAVLVLAEAACFRLGVRAAAARVPLERLRTLTRRRPRVRADRR